MKEQALIPTNLLNWPRVVPLMPDIKLILIALWTSPHMSKDGSVLVPLRPFASGLGLSPEATISGFEILEKADMIVRNPETGVINICDWLRSN